MDTDLKLTPLNDWHVAKGAKMVPFAGYSMPVQYPLGVLKEHLHTRAAAGLFDVSHMGQVLVRGANWESVALAFEALVPAAVLELKDGRQRYGMFLNDKGGILDDLMFARLGDDLFVVVNAACKEQDIALMQAGLKGFDVEVLDRALVALQGPGAEAALGSLNPEAAAMKFMDVRQLDLVGAACIISRSGYTGEDGYEISVPASHAVALADALTAMDGVEPIGLGARDSLRLESGLCLYGNDMDATKTPIEAGLGWAIQKARRSDGVRAGGFPGSEIVLDQMNSGVASRRVGLRPEGRAPMRGGTEIYATETGGEPIGVVTSGGFGPSVEGPVSMGYVLANHAAEDTVLFGDVRGKRMPLRVAAMPFIIQTYKR